MTICNNRYCSLDYYRTLSRLSFCHPNSGPPGRFAATAWRSQKRCRSRSSRSSPRSPWRSGHSRRRRPAPPRSPRRVYYLNQSCCRLVRSQSRQAPVSWALLSSFWLDWRCPGGFCFFGAISECVCRLDSFGFVWIRFIAAATAIIRRDNRRKIIERTWMRIDN